MTQIDFQKASECFPALAELAAKGEEILIVKDNHPFIRIVSAQRLRKRRRFGSARGLIRIADDYGIPLFWE